MTDEGIVTRRTLMAGVGLGIAAAGMPALAATGP